MKPGRVGWLRGRRVVGVLVLGLALLMLPDSTRAPVWLSLVKVENAKAVDFEDGVVWVLALGSDARPGTDVPDGNADAIELVGIDFEHGTAIAFGVPRDSWVDVQGHMDRINVGLSVGGPNLMAQLVEDLFDITPQYVVTTGFGGLTDMIDAIGVVEVRSNRAFEDPEFDLSVRRGLNRMTGEEATSFARSRFPFLRGDFERAANHQALMLAILDRVRAEEDVEGFIEAGATAAFKGLDTALPPGELYRFAQALAQVRPRGVTTCVLDGIDDEVGGRDIIRVDRAQARRLGDDAEADATLERGCRG